MPPMTTRRRLIPVLTAVLVIQSLVARVPHQHQTATVEGQALQNASSVDEAHHCLACSVYAPVVESVAACGVVSGEADSSGVLSCESENDVVAICVSPSPRGPPRGSSHQILSLIDDPPA